MKRIIFISLFFSAVMLLIPLPLLENSTAAVSTSAGIFVIDGDEVKSQEAASDSFRVLNHKTGEITVMSADEYIFGVVCGEMPSSFPEEALKAQAIAAYTFACRRRQSNRKKDYDITTDYTVDQAFISENEALEKWGEGAKENLEKIRTVVEECSGYMVTYEGNAALTVYHSTSAGKTQSVEDVWGGNMPYLKAVSSDGDVVCDEFISIVELSGEEMTEKLKNICKIESFSENIFSDIERNSSGYVLFLKVGGKKVSGAQVRTALELKSTAFLIDFTKNKYTVTVKGNGHGVGMSQNGAAAMATAGSTAEEILCHYYSGCKVEKITLQ